MNSNFFSTKIKLLLVQFCNEFLETPLHLPKENCLEIPGSPFLFLFEQVMLAKLFWAYFDTAKRLMDQMIGK